MPSEMPAGLLYGVDAELAASEACMGCCRGGGHPTMPTAGICSPAVPSTQGGLLYGADAELAASEACMGCCSGSGQLGWWRWGGGAFAEVTAEEAAGKFVSRACQVARLLPTPVREQMPPLLFVLLKW